MPRRQSGKFGIIIIVVMVVILAAYFFSFGNQEGIEVSCSQKNIIGFRTVPPPLMAIVQPAICQIDINATANETTVCSGNKFKILNVEKGIFPCNEVRNLPNVPIKIEVTFYDSDGVQQIGRDVQNETFTKK